MNKVLFDGAYGIKSFGDDAPLIVLDDLLKKRLGTIESVVVSRHADKQYYSRYGIRSIAGLEYESKEESIGKWFRGFNPGDNKSDLNILYNEIASSDLLVLGAGNFLVDYTIDLLKGPIPRFLILSIMANMVGTPVMWYGISVGPLMTTLGRDMSRFSASLASTITVRDAKSINELQEIGVTEGIYQLPDAVYGLKLPRKGLARKFNDWQLAHNKSKQVLVVSVRSIPSSNGMDTEKFILSVAKFCDKMIQKYGYSVLFIPQCIYEHGNFYEDDRNIAKKIIESLESADSAFSIEEDIDVYDCLSLYENASIALCTRLHANVFAAMQGVPVVGINYNPKVREFHRWLDTESNVLDLDEINPDKLVEIIEMAINDSSSFINKSHKIFNKGVSEVGKYADYAIKAIRSSDS